MAIDFAAMLKQAELEMLQNTSIGNIEFDVKEQIVDKTNLPTKSFEEFKIDDFPSTAHYVPNFISIKEADGLLKYLDKGNWTQLKDRKLKNFGGAPHLSGTILEPLPEPLVCLSEKLKEFGVFDVEPDQALVNKYESSGGIGFHMDGPNFKPKAAIISLLSCCLIYFKDTDGVEQKPILLEPNSLFVFYDDLYLKWKHGIKCSEEKVENSEKVANKREKVQVERKKRVSITLRNVSKVHYKMTSISEVLPPHLKEERERRLLWWKKAINEQKHIN